MPKIIQPDKWIPSDGIVLEENAALAVNYPNSILVVAGPGAGKTELLAQKASYLLQTNKCQEPQRILAISFKKDAAENLKQRVKKRCGEDFGYRFVSMTYDAFSKSILDHFRYALPENLRPNGDYIINDNAIIDGAFHAIGYDNPRNLTAAKLGVFYNDTISTVRIPLQGDGLGERVWPLLLKGYADQPACLTFKMICILAEYIIRTNDKLRKAILNTYSHVFLDEFQDTTLHQYELVKTCFENSTTIITAVGDSKQRIMLWAGALESVFDDFLKEFSASKTQLIMNHRSAPRLVELQKKMYGSLQADHVDIKSSEKWDLEDGDIKLFIADTEFVEAEMIAKDILLKVSSGIMPNDVCILCKQTPNVYTGRIVEELSKYGIKARVETEYQDLTKEPVVMLLVSFIRLSIKRRNPNDWETINDSIFSIYGISDIDTPDEYDKKQELLIQKLDECMDLVQSIYSKESLENFTRNIILFWGEAEIRSAFPAYSQGGYFDTIIDSFVNLLWKEYEESSASLKNSIENFLGLNSIPIMTIHKSKGLEYTAVYFVGLEDGAFWNFRNQPMEDRCSFFVALSRAKQYVSFSYCSVRESLRYPLQKHTEINEFFELLTTSGLADVITN